MSKETTHIISKGKVRNAGMFRPGFSGNPKGRPKKDVRLSDLARRRSPEALELLLQIAMNSKTKDKDRIKAISLILDRALGKPS